MGSLNKPSVCYLLSLLKFMLYVGWSRFTQVLWNYKTINDMLTVWISLQSLSFCVVKRKYHISVVTLPPLFCTLFWSDKASLWYCPWRINGYFRLCMLTVPVSFKPGVWPRGVYFTWIPSLVWHESVSVARQRASLSFGLHCTAPGMWCGRGALHACLHCVTGTTTVTRWASFTIALRTA